MILGASTDAQEDNTAFAEKEGFGFPLLCDPSRQLCLAYHAVQDARGVARRISYLIAPDGTIAKAYKAVAPKTHPAEVMADVDALRG